MRIVVLVLIVKVFLSQPSHAQSHVNYTHHPTIDTNCIMMIYTNPHRTKETTPSTGREIGYKSRDLRNEENGTITRQKRDKILSNDNQMSMNYWSENLRIQQTNSTDYSSMLDLYKIFFNGSFKIVYHISRNDSLLIKLLLLFVIRLLLKSSCQLELQFLSFAFLNLDFSIATLISPTPSLSMTSWQTSISSHVGSRFNATHLERVVTSSSVQVSSSVKNGDLKESLKTTNKFSYERGECDMGWIQFGKYCYFPSTEPMIFDHAQRACSYHAANLVSITNKSENDLIFNISRDYFGLPRRNFVWLGMERRESTSQLHWVDENDLNYQNWILGEPDANGACVQMIMEGLWEDSTCMEKKYFICKKRSSYPPPYSRSTELGILIGIPFTFAFIVLFVVTILIFKSIRDADDTFYGYGKNRNKEKMHAAIVNVTASIAHVSAEGTKSNRNEANQPKPSRSSSRSQSLSSSRVNPAVDVSDTGSQSSIPHASNPKINVSDAEAQSHDNLGVDVYDILNFPIQNRKNQNGNRSIPAEPRSTVDLEEIELQACGSAVSLDREPSRFQSTTSLDHLVSKSYIKPKSRKLRGLRKPDAIIRPPGKEGVYRKKTSV